MVVSPHKRKSREKPKLFSGRWFARGKRGVAEKARMKLDARRQTMKEIADKMQLQGHLQLRISEIRRINRDAIRYGDITGRSTAELLRLNSELPESIRLKKEEIDRLPRRNLTVQLAMALLPLYNHRLKMLDFTTPLDQQMVNSKSKEARDSQEFEKENAKMRKRKYSRAGKFLRYWVLGKDGRRFLKYPKSTRGAD